MAVFSDNLGAIWLGNGRCLFRVWAPVATSVDLHLMEPVDRLVSMEKQGDGYFAVTLHDISPGARYFFRVNGQTERPDPASRFQPQGVHQASAVVDGAFMWQDKGWFGLPLRDFVLYELHVGTFTEAGTFDAVIPHLDELKRIGITAIELMPVAQFPGERNWGYDGVHPFAVQNSYGGPEGLKRLVNACHQRGLAVVLDVVYNHLGPEGNYLSEFGPYFTDAYKTPWGCAVNFDGPHSDEVRHYFIENALYWVSEFHVDALRLDAIHAIKDFSARPFLQELGEAVHELAQRVNRRVHVIAESDLNDARVIRPRELGGYGLDAQWSDDFHHSLHTLLTGETQGYYEDFGRIEHLARAWREAFVYTGQYSKRRRRSHGNATQWNAGHQFVVCAQNHDQVGNRMLGDRLSKQGDFSLLKLSAAAVVLSPYIPMLFMGEEYGETAPFQYFVSHGDPGLIESVRRGRRQEFAAFQWKGEVPDPQAETTFRRSKLRHSLRHEGYHAVLPEFYRELLALRRERPSLAKLDKDAQEVIGFELENVLYVRRWTDDDQAVLLFSFADEPSTVTVPVPSGRWVKRLDSADKQWLGTESFIPGRLDSKGELKVTLAARSCCLLVPG
jgi:maltooligosyltrehalose trehalohydrolase